jgi:hypothetical protein
MTTKSNQSECRLPRKDVLQWMGLATASLQSGGLAIAAADKATQEPSGEGYGSDPNMNKNYEPGDFWPLTLGTKDRKTVTVLADIILPEDDLGPAASQLRVPDYIDEWISAPYEEQKRDRKVVLSGLKWMNQESNKRFSADFIELSHQQQIQICDDICYSAEAKSHYKQGAKFFSKFRSLASSAYYASPEGWKAIGYVGNVALASFDGPPQSVLDQLGVKQTVK